MQMAGSEWRNVLGPRCRSLPSSPTSAYPTRFRTPWKTVENAFQTVCTTTKPSRRRFHRVYRPRNTSPIFFSPPPPHRGKSDSGGAFAVFPSARISNRVSLLRACVCVCVIDARVPIYPRARSTAAHLGTSHYARRKEVEATERGREREGERERSASQGEGSPPPPPLSFSPGSQWAGPSAIRLFGYIFFPTKEGGGSVRDEKGRGRERVKPSRSIAN